MSLDEEAEADVLGAQEYSVDAVQYLAKADGQIIGTASLHRGHKRMSHRGEFGICVRKACGGRALRAR